MKKRITFIAYTFLFVFLHGTLNAQNTFPATGPVGIGTKTPKASALLEVKSTTQGMLVPRMTLAQRNAIASPATGLLVYQTNSTPGFYYYTGTAWTAMTQQPGWSLTGNAGTTASNYLGTSDKKNLAFRTNNIQRAVIDNLGNMGVGTTTPGAKLDVSGAAIFASQTISVGNTTGLTNERVILYYDGNVASARLNTASNVSLGFGTSGVNDRVVIDAGGNMGIGTPSPGYILDVAGRMRIRSGGFTSGTWLMNVANTVDAAFLGMLNDNYVGMYGTGIGWGFVMNTTTGNIGIGTFNPTNKLSVNGTIQSKEVRVETGWSDYVFDKDYKLRSLNEVENFIKTNKHLPDVTAGGEIESNGLEVGKVSSQMMKKIEELTLYVIEQEKSINNLKEQNARLEAKMNLLVKKGGK